MTNNDKSKQQTIQQKRAAKAWGQINAMQGKPDKEKKDYASLVRGFAAMIQTDGLAPALVFLEAKAKNNPSSPHYLLSQHLSEWVLAEMKAEKQQSLLRWVIHEDTNSTRYRQIATETIAYLIWLKRFVEAEGWT